MRRVGIYESLITSSLKRELSELENSLHAELDELEEIELPIRISSHFSTLFRRALEDLPAEKRAKAAISLSIEFARLIDKVSPNTDATSDVPEDPPTLLKSISTRLPDGSPDPMITPLVPLLDTVLLTNAPGEPRIGTNVNEEIASADRIDLIMAFIRRSGVAPLAQRLQRHCEQGKPLRVLTTTYTGSTEAAALEQLLRLGAHVKVSYDIDQTRLHAKGWLFHRDSGFSTAYIGSSNLTNQGQGQGREWNVRLSGMKNPEVISKFANLFESYWNNPDFQNYDPETFLIHTEKSDSGPRYVLSNLDVRLEPFQERLLEQIEASRIAGHTRNLLVAATGTGKTVMASVDYSRLKQRLPRARLLFVAHREEILEQAIALFRNVLKDASFGELWVGGNKPRRFDNVFASIQSLNASGLEHLEPAHFDVVIVDEFHHAAASSYKALLEKLDPVQLLALTATPERADGLPILDYFGGRIAAELRLWDAIDQYRLVPFEYYGIHDGIDLRAVPWKRGRGYDQHALSNVLSGNNVWANVVINQLANRMELDQLRGLGFCVSIEHAKFMASVFQNAGIDALAIWSDTQDDERKAALRRLKNGEIKIIFSVDLFNEGVDIPSVNTLLFLRPTDSPVLFLQQLGRGLRLSPNKASCLVLDFVGIHRKEFRFERKLRALIGGSRKKLTEQIERGFPFLPTGCHMEMDQVASRIVLDNIKQSMPSNWKEKTAELRNLASEIGTSITLSDFLKESDLEIDDVYQGNKGWSDLKEAAGLSCFPAGPQEEILRRACGRLLHIDDHERISTYLSFLKSDSPPKVDKLPDREKRLLRMLVASVTDQILEKSSDLKSASATLWSHKQVRTELVELLTVLKDKVDHLTYKLDTHPHIPLQVHSRYTRLEILAAFTAGDAIRIAAWQTGVQWMEADRTDLLAFTIDKSSKGFSPSTRYKDFAISREKIHWESQSATRADSSTGLRYQNHVKMKSHILLFARQNVDERAFWFLGPAKYLSHESEKPMAITWELKHSLPGDLFQSIAVAIA